MNRHMVLAAVATIAAFSLGAVAVSATFNGTFDGTPTTPIPFNDASWDITYSAVGHGEIGSPPDTAGKMVQHGADCGSPGTDGSVRHLAAKIQDEIFLCANHIMTYPPGQTSAVRLVPNQVLDLSSGEGKVRFDVSTLSLSSRDWLSLFIQDWSTQEQKITDANIPSAQGNPRNAIHIEQGGVSFSSEPGTWAIKGFDADRNQTGPIFQNSVDAVLTRSAVTRTTFEAIINRNGHVKFWLPTLNYVIAEGNVAPFSWDRGVVTFIHNSYSPEKGTNPLTRNPVGEQNTWHWDTVSVTPSIPFEIVKTDHRGSKAAGIDTFTFSKPLPAGSVVRFEAFSDTGANAVRIAFDGGPWVNPTKTSLHTHPENAASYSVVGVEGATRITVEVVQGGFGFVRDINNVSAFAFAGVTGTATPTATATPTVAPTATPTLTPTVAPTPSPAPADARCRVDDRNDTNTAWVTREGSWRLIAPDLWVCAVPKVGRIP
jgi:hypothetical protein